MNTTENKEGTVRRRIIVVDDNLIMRESLEKRLTLWNSVEVFESGSEIIKWLEDRPPERVRLVDLLITDLDMPDVDGLQVIEAVRKIHPRLEIWLMSGMHTDESVRLAIDRSFKTVKKNELFAHLEKAELISKSR